MRLKTKWKNDYQNDEYNTFVWIQNLLRTITKIKKQVKPVF